MVVLLVIKASLRFLSFNQFKKAYAYTLRVRQAGVYPKQYIADAAWAVQTAAFRLPFALTCLPQALALKYILRCDPDMPLHIGVQTAAPQGFEAHAWVEKDGHIVIGAWPEETNYRPIWVWQ
ncbi:lasso peptide biosynthesis B2 protein [Salmonirosea aquatica]